MIQGDNAAPEVSVVIAAHNAAATVGDCLAALSAQPGQERAELILADSSTDGTADLVRRRFPGVRVLHFSDRRTIPELRGAGIAASRGRIVALLDPYCIVTEWWLSELLTIHARRPEPAIGGAVELDGGGSTGSTRWAAYFSEYAAFMPPVREGPTAELAGSNIAYKRQALGEVESLGQTGFWKAFVNARLRAEGHQLWTAPALLVTLRKPISFPDFLRTRYHHGRCFAAMRVAEAAGYRRYWRTLTVPLLPVLALWRQARSVWPKGRRRAEFVRAVPPLFLLHSSWAWGELWGYVRGPGRSCAQLFY